MCVLLFWHFAFADSQLESLEMLLVFRANPRLHPAGLEEGYITGLLKKKKKTWHADGEIMLDESINVLWGRK